MMKISPAAKVMVHLSATDHINHIDQFWCSMSLVNHDKGKCKNVPKIYYYDSYGSVSDQCDVPCLPPDCDVTLDFIWDSPVWYVSGWFSNNP